MSPEALTEFTWEYASLAPFLLPLRLHPHLAARGLKLGRHANTGYPGQTIAKRTSGMRRLCMGVKSCNIASTSR
jgi:hypothetical protein